MKRKVLTIIFADVQGYTARTARQSRKENEVFVAEVRSFVEEHAKEKGGTLVKAMGDGFLLTFDSPTDAVFCGEEMQKHIEQRNANVLNQDNFIRFRIGISTGEVTIDDTEDVYGDAVNIAARIQKFAQPNGVYISEATYLAMNKSEIKARDLGLQKFKNALQEIRVYKVAYGSQSTAATEQTMPKINKIPLIITIVCLFAVAALLLLSTRGNKPDRNLHDNDNLIDQSSSFDDREDFDQPSFELRNPLDMDRLFQKADSLLRQGNYQQAVNFCKKQLNKYPDEIRFIEIMSDALLRMRKYTESANVLKQAIKMYPTETFLYMRLADGYEAAGKIDKAIEVLKEYIGKEHRTFDRQEAQRRIEDLKRMKFHSMREQRHLPDNQDFDRGRDDFLNKQSDGDFNSPGQNTFNERKQEQKEIMHKFFQYKQQGNFNAIIDEGIVQLEQTPDNFKLRELLSDAYLKLGDYEQARNHLHYLTDNNPRNPVYLFKLANIFEKEGLYLEAIDTFRDFIEKEHSPFKKENAQKRIDEIEKKM